MTVCDKCGQSYKIGEWPWCPHGSAANFGEEPMEPTWDEHISPGGEYITTRAQRRQIMAREGLDYKKRKIPPGERIFIDLGRR